MIDVTPEVLDSKLRASTVPTMYLFTREGKWTQHVGAVEPDELEAMVKKQLQVAP